MAQKELAAAIELVMLKHKLHAQKRIAALPLMNARLNVMKEQEKQK